eukprot:jgi/Botrbrau1/2787/Bobra.0164s0064.1
MSRDLQSRLFVVENRRQFPKSEDQGQAVKTGFISACFNLPSQRYWTQGMVNFLSDTFKLRDGICGIRRSG